MLKQVMLLSVLLLVLWFGAQPVAAASIPDPGPGLFSADVSGDYICARDVLKEMSNRCPPFGPGTRALRLEYLRASLPDPLPELPVEELEQPEGAVSAYSFAYVRQLPAPTYGHPAEAEVGLPPLRQFLAGDNWVSAMGSVDYNGQTWYQINENEFIQANYIVFANPSRFGGVVLTEQPQNPFGWINRNVNPSTTPGGEPRADIALGRYQLVTFFAQERVGSQLWYMIGADQWVEQNCVARVDVDPIPEGVGPGDKWIEVDTFEQTLAAYEGARMVFATLISSGRQGTWTPNGLTRIWAKLPSTPMINQDTTPDSPAWYYLEDVEYTQYFNGAYALHTAYWHDAFGFVRSHGCVNLAPLDARWLFQWTSPYVPETARIVYSSDAEPGTWVWVHQSDPLGAP